MRLIVSLVLLVFLSACTTSVLAPPFQLVQKALVIEVEQTQQRLSQQLDLNFQGFEIHRLSITQEQPLTIQNLLTYRVRGTYELTLKLPKRQIKQSQKPFEFYLQLQKEGKTWRLLLPDNGVKGSWRSYLIS